MKQTTTTDTILREKLIKILYQDTKTYKIMHESATLKEDAKALDEGIDEILALFEASLQKTREEVLEEVKIALGDPDNYTDRGTFKPKRFLASLKGEKK